MNRLVEPGEWQAFLQKYAGATDSAAWPGTIGASEEQLLETEKRLKVKLPPSYRAFLKASNGWDYSDVILPKLLPVQKIGWFREDHREWLGAFQTDVVELDMSEQDYFDYRNVEIYNYDDVHLAETLSISEQHEGAIVLLNPMVVWPDGEWETWFFANWHAGAARYSSFSEWMRYQLCQLIGDAFQDSSHGLPTVYLDRPGNEPRRIRPREKLPGLEGVLLKLGSDDDKKRLRAAEELGRLGGQAAVDALLIALKNDPSGKVRSAAAESLGSLHPPEAVEALITAAIDPLVRSGAIHALREFRDEISAAFLLTLVENCNDYTASAAHVLSVRGDNRAIPPLVRFLVSVDSPEIEIQRIGDMAGKILAVAEFGEAGFAALEPLASHPEAKVRHRAISGISFIAYAADDKALRKKAHELLRRRVELETDDVLRCSLQGTIELTSTRNR